MGSYAEIMKAYLASNPPDYGSENVDSLLEMLYLHYSEFNPMETEKIREDFRRMEGLLCSLTEEERDAVFSLICSLCVEQEQRAFLEGFRVGARIMLEIKIHY